LGEDGTKGVSHSGTERGTSSKSSESYGPRLGRRECVGQYTEASWDRCSCTTTLDPSEDIDCYFIFCETTTEREDALNDRANDESFFSAVKICETTEEEEETTRTEGERRDEPLEFIR
jgi:hypothetical protein